MRERGAAGLSALAEYRRRRQLYAAERRDRLRPQLLIGALAAVAAGVVVGFVVSLLGGGTGDAVIAGLLAALLAGAVAAARYLRPVSEIEAWREDAEAERRTARVLDRLGRAGYTVLHDRSLPGSAGNIDHLVVGPSGAWVVESDSHRGLLRQDRAGLWADRVPLRAKLGLVAWMADQVTAQLGAELPAGWEVGTQPVVSFARADLPNGLALLDGVVLLPVSSVTDYILQAGVVLTPLDVAVLVDVTERTFPPYPVAGGATTQPPGWRRALRRH